MKRFCTPRVKAVQAVGRSSLRWPAPRGRAGFATITALLLIIATIALTTLSGLFALEARRTQRERSTAQVRQLFLAGGIIAQQRLANGEPGGTQTLQLPLPAELSARGASLSMGIHPAASPDRRLAIITAQINGRQTQEEVELVQREGKWSITDARITASDRPTTIPATQPLAP